MSVIVDDLSSIADFSVDDGSSSEGSIVEEKTFDFFRKYCMDNDESVDDNVDAFDITSLQAHILDSIVVLLRVQSFQSKHIVTGNRLKNKLFSQVVNKLLNPNIDAVDSFRSVEESVLISKKVKKNVELTDGGRSLGKGKKYLNPDEEAANIGTALLLQAFPDETKIVDGRGWLPLHWLVALGNQCALTSREIRDIISSDPLAVMRGYNLRSNATPAHLCCSIGDSTYALLMLKQLAESSQNRIAFTPNNDNDLPIHWAAANSSNLELMEYLLDINPESTKVLGLDMMSPLYCAVDKSNRSFGVIKLLVDKDPQSCALCDVNGNTVLHYLGICAESARDLEIIAYIASKNPSVLSIQNQDLLTPMHLLCKNSTICETNTKELVMLMSKLLKPHPEYASYASISGKLPAHFAAEFSTIEVLELLLNAYPSATAVVAKGKSGTLMHCAIKGDRFDNFDYLYERYPKAITTPDDEGYLPLHYAAMNGSFDLFQEIYNVYPDAVFVKSKDEQKLPLHLLMEDVANGIAPDSDDDDIFRLLLNAYPESCVIPDAKGNVPAHLTTNLYIKRLIFRSYPAADIHQELPLMNWNERRGGMYCAFIAKYVNERKKGILSRLRKQSLELTKKVISYL
jgi:ankyrin repeat protein